MQVGPKDSAVHMLRRVQQVVMIALVPWREPAWALLHERMALLTQRCAEISHGAPEAVHQARQRAATIAATIAAHVPADLRQTPSSVSIRPASTS